MFIMQQTFQDQPATQEAERISCPAVTEMKQNYLCLFPHTLPLHWRVCFKEGLAEVLLGVGSPAEAFFDLFMLVLNNIVQSITCASFCSCLDD